MVSAGRFAESDYINVDLVASASNKNGVIVQDAQVKKNNFGGESLEFGIDLAGKVKSWSPTKKWLGAVISVWGDDTRGWVGKMVSFSIQNGKLVATPLMDHVAALMQPEKK